MSSPITLNHEIETEFFNFIKERQRIWYLKEIRKVEPFWTEDEILKKYRFCNVFRELDSGTYVMYNALKDRDKYTQFFNVILYRMFNNKNLFTSGVLPISPFDFDRKKFVAILDEFKSMYGTIFNTAYLTSQYSFKRDIPEEIGVKHIQFSYSIEEIAQNILDHVEYLYKNGNPEQVFKRILEFKLVGEFLAFQHVLDLCQLGFLGYTENDFYIIGPGALTGIAVLLECDPETLSLSVCDQVIEHLYESQKEHLKGEVWERISFKGSVCYPYLSRSAIEFCLCEFRKYNNYLLNKGRKRIFIYKERPVETV